MSYCRPVSLCLWMCLGWRPHFEDCSSLLTPLAPYGVYHLSHEICYFANLLLLVDMVFNPFGMVFCIPPWLCAIVDLTFPIGQLLELLQLRWHLSDTVDPLMKILIQLEFASSEIMQVNGSKCPRL